MADLTTLLNKFLQDLYAGTIGGGGAPALQLTLTRAGIGVTSTDGVILTNTTDAAAGAQQMSPRVRFRGEGWKTDATAASQTVDIINELLPVQGASAPTANLLWKSSVNGGAYSTILTLTSSGLLGAGSVGTGAPFWNADSGLFGFSARFHLSSPADGQVVLRDAALTAGVGLDVATDAVLKVRTRAQSAYATVDALAFQRAGVVTFSGTAPTIASGFGTTPSIASSNGSVAFEINVGTGGTATAGVITLPAATTGWVVHCLDITNAATSNTVQTAGTTTSATMSNFSRTTGLLTAWAASDIIRCTAVAY